MSKIAVLGSAGMAGSMITSYLKKQDHYVTGFNRTPITGYYDKLFDFKNDYQVKLLTEWIRVNQPDYIINCIGYLVKESQNNPAEGVYLNSYLPHWLELITKNTNTKIIHLSTDCIFNGKAWWYEETNLPTETNYYGKTKALGELNNNKDLTLRQSIIGPAPQKKNTGLFNWIYNTKGKVDGYRASIWNGITTLELAKQIHNIISLSENLSGIYHLIPNSQKIISKFSLLQKIKNIFNLPVVVNEVTGKSEHKILKNTRLEDYKCFIPDYNVQLQELKEYIDSNNIVIGIL